ncbi:MAG: CoB--CoM heterodisulfide reductase iron-sulfur subunit B family protein [Methanomassiliicoccales archaeon]
MSKRYLLFSGCLIPTRLPFLEASSRYVLDKLDVVYSPFPDATCCVEPIGLRSLGNDTWLAMSARLLSIAEENESTVLSLCNGCFMSLVEARHELKNAATRKRINELIERTGHRYEGNAEVKHLLQLVHENEAQVRPAAVRRMEHLDLALHPGCHLMRPSEVLREERRYSPKALAEVVSWTGARTVDDPEWAQCCGGGLAGIDDSISASILNENVARFRESGANCIVTPCPFCFVQFDLRQKDGIPVLYLAELLALAFGASPDKIGLKYHRTKLPSSIGSAAALAP